MSNKELTEKARNMLRSAVSIDQEKLEEALRYLHEYLFATKQPVDYSDAEVMEVFDLFQLTHQLLSISKRRGGKAKPSRRS